MIKGNPVNFTENLTDLEEYNINLLREDCSQCISNIQDLKL
jgi:hypothetical protein